VINSLFTTVIATISTGLGTQPFNSLVFCPTNNCVYVGDFILGQVYVVDTSTNTLLTTIAVTGATRSLVFVPSTNEVWVTTQNVASPINVIDVNTNTVVSIPVTPASQPQDIIYYPTNNSVFVSSTTTNQLWQIDVTTRVLLAQYPTPQTTPLGIGLVNNKIYVGYLTLTTSFDIFDIPTVSFTNNVSYGGLGASIFQNNFLFISAFNLVYTSLTDGNIIVIDPNTETIVNQFTGLFGTFPNVFFNPFNNFFWQKAGTIFRYWSTTIVVTPFYISGSVNYNQFVNSLYSEPIYISMIRFFVQNQEQLYNQLQFTKIDSNGNQMFFPEFPITKVDSYQEQGNIASIELNGLEFDGRTYINQYVINANQTVSFEIVYRQIERFDVTKTYPIFFKQKVQLKQYIKEDYSNYDVEFN
jgi:hypothetical protein